MFPLDLTCESSAWEPPSAPPTNGIHTDADHEIEPPPRPRLVRASRSLLLTLAALLLAAGCGGAVDSSGSTEPAQVSSSESAPVDNSDGDLGEVDGGGQEEEEEEEEEKFSWGLPGGDLSLDALGDVFNQLRAGRCAEAESRLEAFLKNEQLFSSPGQEQLYRAAIAVCSGDLVTGRQSLDDAAVTRHPGDCRVYKAVTSVLDQRPQESIECPTPAVPEASSDGPEEPTPGPDGATKEPLNPSSTESTATPDPAPQADLTPAADDGAAPPTEDGSDGNG